MSTEESLNHTIRSQIDILRLDAGTQKKVKKIFKTMESEIVQQIAMIDPTSPKLTKWKKQRLLRLKTQANNIIGEKYKEVKKTVDKDLYDMAKYEAGNSVLTLNKALGANVFDVTYTATQLKTLVNTTLIDGETIGGWWNDQSLTFQKKFNRTMRDVTEQIQLGTLKGEGIGELVRRVKGTTNIIGLTKGVKNASEALTRTAYMQIAGKVRMDTYKEFDDVLRGYQYLATLDNRTCLTGEMKIKTPDGYIPIKDLKVGDIVIGPTGKHRMIKNTSQKTTKKLVVVTLENGKKIKCTKDHPFLLKSGEWIDAENLTIDMELAEMATLQMLKDNAS